MFLQKPWTSQLIKRPICHHTETSQLICSSNQMTGFYMTTTLVFNVLMKNHGGGFFIYHGHCQVFELTHLSSNPDKEFLLKEKDRNSYPLDKDLYSANNKYSWGTFKNNVQVLLLTLFTAESQFFHAIVQCIKQ